MMIDSEFLWPFIDDKLFLEGGAYETNAHITRWTAEWITMAEGYAAMAEIAVSSCSRNERDMIVFPVVFCYRHAVELYLKYALHKARRVLGIPNANPTKQPDHFLLNLWNELTPLIKRRWPNDSCEDLIAVDARLKEFDEEPRETYLFPISKTKKKYITADKSIDLVNYCRSGRKIINFLSAAIDGFSDST